MSVTVGRWLLISSVWILAVRPRVLMHFCTLKRRTSWMTTHPHSHARIPRHWWKGAGGAHPAHRAHCRCRLAPECSRLRRSHREARSTWCVESLDMGNRHLGSKGDANYSIGTDPLQALPLHAARAYSLEWTSFSSGLPPSKPGRAKGKCHLFSHTSWERHWQVCLLFSQECGADGSIESASGWLRL